MIRIPLGGRRAGGRGGLEGAPDIRPADRHDPDVPDTYSGVPVQASQARRSHRRLLGASDRPREVYNARLTQGALPMAAIETEHDDCGEAWTRHGGDPSPPTSLFDLWWRTGGGCASSCGCWPDWLAWPLICGRKGRNCSPRSQTVIASTVAEHLPKYLYSLAGPGPPSPRAVSFACWQVPAHTAVDISRPAPGSSPASVESIISFRATEEDESARDAPGRDTNPTTP